MAKKIIEASIFLVCELAAVCGCTHAGNVVRLEQRSAAGITSLTLMDYTIPVVSVTTGPSLCIWQTREADASMKFKAFCTTTNETSALGIYESREQKQMSFDGVVFSSTNAVPDTL